MIRASLYIWLIYLTSPMFHLKYNRSYEFSQSRFVKYLSPGFFACIHPQISFLLSNRICSLKWNGWKNTTQRPQTSRTVFLSLMWHGRLPHCTGLISWGRWKQQRFIRWPQWRLRDSLFSSLCLVTWCVTLYLPSIALRSLSSWNLLDHTHSFARLRCLTDLLHSWVTAL